MTEPPGHNSEYKLLHREVGITAPSTVDVVQVILNLSDLWKDIVGPLDCLKANEPTDWNTNGANSETITLGAGLDGFIVRFNHVHGADQYGVDAKAGARNGKIYGNLLEDIEKYAIYLDAGRRWVSDVDVYDNVIRRCRNGVVLAREAATVNGPGFAAEYAANPSDFDVMELARIRVWNTTTFQTGQSGIFCQRHPRDGAAGKIEDIYIGLNTVANANREASGNPSPTTFDLNLSGWFDADMQAANVTQRVKFFCNIISNSTDPIRVQNTFTGQPGYTEVRNFFGDPQFANLNSSPPNLRLVVGSPAESLSIAEDLVGYEFDADGLIRTVGPIGAYSERVNNVGPVISRTTYDDGTKAISFNTSEGGTLHWAVYLNSDGQPVIDGDGIWTGTTQETGSSIVAAAGTGSFTGSYTTTTGDRLAYYIVDASGNVSNVIVEEITLVAARRGLRVQTGLTAAGADGVVIPTDFAADLIIAVVDGKPLTWRSNISWSGKTQKFRAGSSTRFFGASDRPYFDAFGSDGFKVDSAFAGSGESVRWVAINFGQSKISHTSIIGNGTAGRDVLFSPHGTPDAVLSKRDSPRAMIITSGNIDSEQADAAGGLLAGAMILIDGGVTLSGDVHLNQNDDPALGEASEMIGFNSDVDIDVVEWSGDNAGTRTFAAGATVALVFASGSQAAMVVTADGSRDVEGATVAGASVANTQFTVPTGFNATGQTYTAICLRDSGDAAQTETPDTPANAGIVTYSEATLAPSINVSGAVSYEFFGRIQSMDTADDYFAPVLLNGSGSDGDTAGTGYNLGIYGFGDDPDSNSWFGPALRWLQGDYMLRNRRQPADQTINGYNLNSGIILPIGVPVHLVMTFDGTNKWRMYLNGRMVKEYNLATAFNTGGQGAGLPLYVGYADLNGTKTLTRSEIYRAQVWNSDIGDADALALYGDIMGGSYGGAVADHSFDFRGGVLPAGVSGIAIGAPAADARIYPIWRAGTLVASAAAPVPNASTGAVVCTTTGTGNGRVTFKLEPDTTYTLRTSIDTGVTDRIICRRSSDGQAASGTSLYDLSGLTGTTLARVDVFTTGSSDEWLALVAVNANGEAFTITPEMYLEYGDTT